MKYLSTFLVFPVLLLQNIDGLNYIDKSLEDSTLRIQSIKSGSDAKEGEAPYSVAMVCGDSVKINWCGGSLISEKHVLTAAHCLDNCLNGDDTLRSFRSYHGRIGSQKWGEGWYLEFKDYWWHPEWNSTTFKYDAGVVILRKPVTFDAFIGPIGLDFDWLAAEEFVYLAGWGSVDISIENHFVHYGSPASNLQIFFMNTISTEDCIKGIDAKSRDIGYKLHNLDPNLEVCTSNSVDHGMCYGDSGSALISADTAKQVGIMSWGYSCARGVPDVYLRISAIEYFLKDVLGDLIK